MKHLNKLALLTITLTLTLLIQYTSPANAFSITETASRSEHLGDIRWEKGTYTVTIRTSENTPFDVNNPTGIISDNDRQTMTLTYTFDSYDTSAVIYQGNSQEKGYIILPLGSTKSKNLNFENTQTTLSYDPKTTNTVELEVTQLGYNATITKSETKDGVTTRTIRYETKKIDNSLYLSVRYEYTRTPDYEADFWWSPAPPKYGLPVTIHISTKTSDSYLNAPPLSSWTWKLNDEPRPDLDNQTLWTTMLSLGPNTATLTTEHPTMGTRTKTKTINVETVPIEPIRFFYFYPDGGSNEKTPRVGEEATVYVHTEGWRHLKECTLTVDGEEISKAIAAFQHPQKLPWTPQSPGEHTIVVTVLDTEGQIYSIVEKVDVLPSTTSTEIIGVMPTITVEGTPPYLTGDTIQVTGKVQIGESPYDEKPLLIELLRGDNILHSQNTDTDKTGTYTTTLTIPPILTEKTHEIEYWIIRVTATDPKYSGDNEAGINVANLWLEAKPIRWVQITEDYSNGNLIAANVPLGIRAEINCPTLQTHNIERTIQITATLIIEHQGQKQEYTQQIPVNQEGGAYDFYLTPQEGPYNFVLMVDPENQHMLQGGSLDIHNPLTKMLILLGKEMQPLDLKYIKVDPAALIGETPLPTVEEWLTFWKFVHQQEDFLKTVFPLPRNYINVKIPQERLTIESGTRIPLWDTILEVRMGTHLLQLGIRDFYEKSKNIYVYPDSDTFWGNAISGATFGDKFPNTIIIRYNAPVGVSAHEITHTLGVHNDIEEYDWPDPPGANSQGIYGVYLSGAPIKTGLIMKNNQIYDMAIAEDQKTAFNNGHPFCYAGDNSIITNGRLWVCNYTYSQIFKALLDPPDIPVLYVSGIIFENKTAEFLDFATGLGLPDTFIEGDHTIQLLSNTDEILYEQSFGYTRETITPFGFKVPLPETIKTVRLLKDTTVLTTKTISDNPPTIQITDLMLGENATINWTGKDIDNDNITYTLMYTWDAGETWTVLDLNQQETTYTQPLNALPGGEECYFKLAANDGFTTTYTQTDSFTNEDKTPIAIIISEENQTLANWIILEGFAVDIEDGLLPDEQLVWQSDTQGTLGTGTTLNATLINGAHIITLTAIDSAGNQGTSTATITIGTQSDTNWLIYMIIIVAIIGSGVLLYRRRKKTTTNQTPSCPQCGETATWIEEYQRWYCYECQEYI